MRLRYRLTRADLIRAQTRAIFHNKVFIGVLVLFFAFLWWSTFTMAEIAKGSEAVRAITATIMAGIGLIGVLLFTAIILSLQTLLRRDKGVLGEHTLELTEEGVVESTDVNRSLANWRTQFKIRDTRHYAYIYISESNAHIVPKKREPLEGCTEVFLIRLREHIARFQAPGASAGTGAMSTDGSPPAIR